MRTFNDSLISVLLSVLITLNLMKPNTFNPRVQSHLKHFRNLLLVVN